MAKQAFKLINEAMGLMDQVREKMLDILAVCETEEGHEAIADAVTASATALVNANTALEDVLSAVEDISDVR